MDNKDSKMTPHDHYLRGIQAAIDCLEQKDKSFEARHPFSGAPFRLGLIALKTFKNEQSTSAEAKGDETL